MLAMARMAGCVPYPVAVETNRDAGPGAVCGVLGVTPFQAFLHVWREICFSRAWQCSQTPEPQGELNGI